MAGIKLGNVFKAVVTISAVAGSAAFVVDKVEEKKRKKQELPSALKEKGFYEANLKRPLDCALATGGLLVLSPVLLVTSVLVRTKLGSPIIFKQERPGKDGKIFTLYKFRSMTDQKDENGNLLPDDVRLTRFGKALRSTSLDELPELFNIIKGEMAIVGPRPLLVEYLDKYSEQQKKRHDVRPGLTGLAQVNGRNLISWDKKFEYDVEYVSNVSFLGDLKLLVKTMYKVVSKDGISSQQTATMPKFKGNFE